MTWPTTWQSLTDETLIHWRFDAQTPTILVVAFDLNADHVLEERCAAVLSDDEHQRAARFVTPLLRRRFRVAHGTLRLLLSRVLGTSASNLTFEIQSGGKPRLLANHALHFNLSHSDDGAMIALARREVGVDLQQHSPRYEFLELARRWFATAEYHALSQADVGLLAQSFFATWTRKEAVVKALGTGLHTPMADFAVSTAIDAAMHSIHSAIPELHPLRVASVPMDEVWSAAVSAAGDDWRSECRRVIPEALFA